MTPAEKRKARSEHYRKLGKIGGPARARSLTPERRREIALKAIYTRWRKKDKSGKKEG